MRFRSLKRQKLEREYRRWKVEYLVQHPKCVCGKRSEVIHHMTRGANRISGLCNPACVLALCEFCHSRIHDEGWSLEKQLAAKFRYDCEEYDLAEFNRVRSGYVRIFQHDVNQWLI